MNILKSIKEQMPRRLPAFFAIPTIALLILVVLMSSRTGKPLTVFLQDIFLLTSAPLYPGFTSNIGMVIWSFAAAVCFYTFYILRKSGKDKKTGLFLMISGLLALLFSH